MLDGKSSLAFPFRFANSVTKYMHASRLPLARLDEETLCRAAIRSTGLTDFGDPYYREGLLTLLESAEKDANLHFIGRVCLHRMIVTYLSNRLLLAEAQKRTPELFQHPLIPPLIILGLPRTGTTFLHRMLALDPAHRAAPMWELFRPLPCGIPDLRREHMKASVNFIRKLNPKLDRVHYFDVDIPEECIILQGTTFASIFFSVFAPVFGYGEWYAAHDHFKAYQEYYRLLQVLQAVEPTRRLILKAPAHTGSLFTLYRLMPNTLIIQAHRHPVAVCNSANSNIYSHHVRVAEKIDVARLGKGTINLLTQWAAISLTFRETNPNVICDIFYDQLVVDPMGTVKGIYDHFGLAWSGAFEERLQTYVRDNPQDKHGKHCYSSVDFGLTDEAIAERFTEYSRRFGFDY